MLKRLFDPLEFGVRVGTPKTFIDKGRYGLLSEEIFHQQVIDWYPSPKEKKNSRCAYFLHVSGGTVVGATSESTHVVVNGMSYSGRRAFEADILLVDVQVEDYDGEDVWAGVRFQDTIERLAFEAGGW